MINRRVAALLVLVAPLAACVSGSESTTPSPNPNAAFTARFAPLDGIMPFPNDLYFNGSKTGTLNIPGSALVPQNAPLLELNHLDGFGTQSDISIYFTQPVDATTLATGVVVLQVTSDATTKAVTGVTKPLIPGTDYSIGLSPGLDSGGEIVTIKPLHPLVASTVTGGTTPKPATYLVIVTTGVKSSAGTAVAPSSDYSTVVAADVPALSPTPNPLKINMAATDPLFPVAEFTLGQLAVAAAAGVTPDKVAVTFSFSTAYLGVTLGDISATATASTGAVAATGLNTHNLEAALPGIADVYAGVVTIPYYLSVPSAGNPTAALTGYWHGSVHGGDTSVLDPLPKATSNQTIPVLVTVPNANAGCGATPAGGWPVVIFQHGITQNRTNVIAVADALAQACFAAVAIDLPLHGITDTSTDVATNPFYQNQLFKGTPAAALMTGERTFNMDLENNTTLAAGSDGQVDSSGAWFINLTSTVTSRDNLREAAADLISLTRTIQAGGIAGAPLNGAHIAFVGHSLGAIVGSTYLAVDPTAIAGVLGMPGGHIAELLRNSAEFGPIIDGQLAANGLVKGSQSYYDFYSEAQAMVEDGDPANYFTFTVAQHPVHIIEVVGDGTASNPPDQVVPNIATDALIGQTNITTPVSALGLNAIAAGAPTLAQFTAGDHGSLLDPTPPTTAQAAVYLAVTTEMQKEMANLVGSALLGAPATVVSDNSSLSTTLKK